MEAAKKAVIIGLDGLNPDLVYQWRDELSNLRRLMEYGIYGRIKSTVPPITPQAWSCVLCGKNPGHFGYWDFTYRDDYSYGQPELVSSEVRDERAESLYKILPKHGKKVAIINVPVSYPPPEIPNGFSISSFMTPSIKRQFTYPDSLKEEIKNLIGEYIIDASTSDMNFRQMDKDEVAKRIYDMDKQRFDLTKYFIKDKNCDFVFTVVMGTDRMPHLFYRYFDENHKNYTYHEKYKDALKNHYTFCDKNVGEILGLVDDNTSIIIVSDHSVQSLDGRINLNQWLIQEGYMRLKTRPEGLTPLMQADIDWNETRAWATGFTGQLYLNIKGRESEGTVDPNDYDKVLDELSEKIINITDEEGKKLETQVFKRKEIHSGEYSRFGPDLFIYFDNCHWNISELIGYDSIYSYDTPKGPDDAGHGPYGFFAIYGPGIPKAGEVSGADLLDIAPTVFHLMGVPIPADMEGKVLTKKKSAYSEEDKKEVKERLAKIGYLG
ncbi:MAG: alkaline phosphatase family protein [Candidatus Heimdallarchaeota archaeon]